MNCVLDACSNRDELYRNTTPKALIEVNAADVSCNRPEHSTGKPEVIIKSMQAPECRPKRPGVRPRPARKETDQQTIVEQNLFSETNDTEYAAINVLRLPVIA